MSGKVAAMMNAPELLNAHFQEMQANFAAWCALYADDAVMEYPYGAYAGVSSPLKGIAAISKSVKGFLDSVRDLQIGIPKVYRIEGEDAVVAEFSATALPCENRPNIGIAVIDKITSIW